MHALSAIIIILIIITIIASTIVIPYERAMDRALSGFWVGDPSFLQKSGLSKMYLYIAPIKYGESPKHGHIVMSGGNGDVISNQGVEIKYANWWGAVRRGISALTAHFGGSGYPYNFEATFAFDDTPIMPNKMIVEICALTGTLSLRTKGKLYAYLLRDNEASQAANKNYGK